MIDINATDFVGRFKIDDGVVGVVGFGFVGRAVENYFKRACRVLVYDAAMPELGTLDAVVKESQVVFVCVPTPMRLDGSCHTGIVESVVVDVERLALATGRNLGGFVVVLKSTVPPGFTDRLRERHSGMRIVFSPEFLTEKNSLVDFETANRMIFGGDEEDALVVSKYFAGVSPQRVVDDRLLLLQCSPTVAEMTKLYANGILAAKVAFSNDVYRVCERLGVPFEEVRALACLDPRIGASHTRVPGPDGDFGFGGHCFPKDLNSLRAVARALEVPERLFTAVLEQNDEVRGKKDWLEMKGRAVIDA